MNEYKSLVVTPTLKSFCEQVAKFPANARVRVSLDMLERIEKEQAQQTSSADALRNGTFVEDAGEPEETVIFRSLK